MGVGDRVKCKGKVRLMCDAGEVNVDPCIINVTR